MDLTPIWTYLTTEGIAVLMKILAACAFWVVGRWLIHRITALLGLALTRNAVDPTLTRYLGSVVAVLLNVVLVIGILGYFGIETTSFAALLAGAGIAIGTAWSGLLAHFAAGAFLLVLRPFKVGDFVSAGGMVGTVKEIGLFGTTFLAPDNVVAVVGNNRIFADTILNFSSTPARRVERTALIAGSVDPQDAMRRFRAEIVKIPNVSTAMPPEIDILDFTLAGTVIAVRCYTHTDHYWQVYFDTNAMIARVGGVAGWAPPAPVQIVHNFAGSAAPTEG